jgi:integrase
MAKVKLKHLQIYRDRHGRERAYYRRPGHPLVALPLPVDSDEFIEAYAGAHRGASSQKVAPGVVSDGSVSAAIREYLGSGEFGQLAENTRKNYRYSLQKFESRCGRLPFKLCDKRSLTLMKDEMQDKPHVFNALLLCLRSFMRVAVERNLRGDNPAEEVRPYVIKNRGEFEPWDEAQMQQFRDCWAPGTNERLAFELAVRTTLRVSDLCRLDRTNIETTAGQTRIRIINTKNRKETCTKVTAGLVALIEMIPLNQSTLVVNSVSNPMSPMNFTRWFSRAARQAGLVKRTAHGLRKTRSIQFRENSVSNHAGMAVTGHTSNRMFDYYARDADTVHLADQAIDAVAAIDEVWDREILSNLAKVRQNQALNHL